jgi:hypothetical protein
LARRRIARAKRLAGKLRARRRSTAEPDRRTAEELERRLDATRARLRRENPPRDDEPAR